MNHIQNFICEYFICGVLPTTLVFLIIFSPILTNRIKQKRTLKLCTRNIHQFIENFKEFGPKLIKLTNTCVLKTGVLPHCQYCLNICE